MSSTPSRANAKSLLGRYTNVARDHPLNTVAQQACDYTSISFDVDGDDTSYDEYPYVYLRCDEPVAGYSVTEI